MGLLRLRSSGGAGSGPAGTAGGTLVGSASAAASAASLTFALGGGNTAAWACLYKSGADEGSRVATSGTSGTVSLTPLAGGSYTARLYSASTGGVLLWETPSFTVTPWLPSALGAALIFAADPNDTSSAPDDGTGKVATFKHLYSSAALVAPSGARPSIVTSGGASGTKRVLGFSATSYLRANGSAFNALTTMVNGSALNASNMTVICAVNIGSDNSSWAEPWVWVDNSPNNWVHVMQRGTASMEFGVRDSVPTDFKANVAGSHTGWMYLSATKSGGSMVFRKNGTQVATATCTSAIVPVFTDFLINATLESGAVSSADHDVLGYGGIIVANTALTGTTLAAAETWVKTTAGL